MTRRKWERGSAAVEVAIATPLLMMIVMLVAAGGRLALAQGSVQQAAADAARSASIARTAGAATATGQSAASTTLATQGLHCMSSSVTINTSGFGVAVGSQARVSATVSCTVRLADLGLSGMPGSKVITATISSPLDTYRGRTGS